MRNIQSDGIAEDLIRAFVQVGCAEIHVKTLVEKYNAKLENGLVDLETELDNQTEKIQDATDELNKLAELRRDMMKKLFDMYDGDIDWHCATKHLGVGAYTLFECYEASDDDPELYTMALEANKRFIHSLSHYLGMEIVECAACFADAISAKNALLDKESMIK